MKFENTGRCALLFMLMAMIGIAPRCFAEAASDKATMENIKQETHDLMQSLKAFSIAQRDEAVQKTKAALDNLDRRIDVMETRIDNNWEKMDAAAREKARASIKALRKQRTEVAEWYGSLKSSSAEAWGHMKQGLADAYRSLYQAWEQSEKDFRSDKKAAQD